MLWYLVLAGLAIITGIGLTVKRLRRWFLLSGCFGELVALVVLVLASHNLIAPPVILALFPGSIAAIVDPSTVPNKIMVAAFALVSNFIVYGALGTLLGLCFRRRSDPEVQNAR